MARIVVDGMNVIGTRPDGWWRDRDAAARRLLQRLQHASRASDDSFTLVLEGLLLTDAAEGHHDGVELRYARRRGRDAADDRIVELVADAADATDLVVVTSDRDLVDRVTARGAATEGASTFLRRLDGLEA